MKAYETSSAEMGPLVCVDCKGSTNPGYKCWWMDIWRCKSCFVADREMQINWTYNDSLITGTYRKNHEYY